MSETTEALSLAADFPRAMRDQWLKLVDAVLKGASLDRLTHTTRDGLRIEPLYAGRSDETPLHARAGRWQIDQRIDHPDPAQANAQALEDLENGATALLLVFSGGPSAYGYGLDGSEAAIERALDGIYLDAGIAIETDLNPQFKDAGHRFAGLIKKRGIAPAAVNIRFNYDPVGAEALAGSAPMPWHVVAPIFVSLVRDLSDQGFKGPFAAANGRLVHAAGGSEAQELAFALAAAVAYLRALEAGGVPLDAARRMIHFRLAADADQFLTMAKFRALRKLWARVEQACGVEPEPIFISAETAWRMMTQRDVHVNMLRTTIAAFASGLAGADAISVLPHTIALGLPDALARRVARNTQLILMEESNLHRVADPAAGSGGIEDLTDQLCHASWKLFQEIEAAGGAVAALESGLLQKKVAQTHSERERAVATRKDPLTGTSEFPHLAELAVSALSVAPNPAPPPPLRGRSASEASREGGGKEFAVLPCIRLAEPFERLRDASDRVLAERGSRPKVFLANLGTAAEFTTRAIFAKNFFEAGGIEAVEFHPSRREAAPATDIAALVAAFESSGAKLACLCSSDAVYERQAAAAAQALAQAAGATHIYLAGRPKERQPLLGAGVQSFVHAGCDALATLQAAHDMLGISAKSDIR